MAPRNEYQSYVPQVFDLATKNATAEQIAHKLYYIETETIGVIGSYEACRRIAETIMKKKKELIKE